ncbi:hypothetical protein TanjilG_21224 [Lupinus angustifolius]|uniref:Uncharacterized protein n=1 Tax=Lupinus angustifolius TaxID=3871 RepID=A0A4P1R8W3_LUPAN|nr:hypothetical protein TanjilG_21224 [Lupinus angustifolius]
MAGLQQYNFFPTDFFYPKPQPSSNPTLLPLQTPNSEDNNQHQHQHQQPRNMVKTTPSSSLVYTHKTQQSLCRVDNKVSKFPTNPLSWVVWMDQGEDLEAF